MDVYIGLDVSLASTAIWVLGEKGKIVTEARVASAPESLVSFMRELPHGIAAIGLEAGPLSQWLYKGLIDAGFEAVLMETRQVKAALKAMPIKTDRRDAEGIARLLQMGWFRPVHCKAVSSQEMRALLTSRKSVLDTIIKIELSLRGVLRNFGLKLGAVSKGRYEARVRELIAGNAMLEAAAEPILRARAALRRELAELEKLVRNLASQVPVSVRERPLARRQGQYAFQFDRIVIQSACEHIPEKRHIGRFVRERFLCGAGLSWLGRSGQQEGSRQCGKDCKTWHGHFRSLGEADK